MLERGVVIKSGKDGLDIQLQANDSCESCHACFIDKNKLKVLHIDDTRPINPGEMVEIEVQTGFALQSAFLIFVFPLIMLIVGYYIFNQLIDIPGINEMYESVLGAISGLFTAYLVVYFFDKYLHRTRSDKQIRIVRVIKNKFD